MQFTQFKVKLNDGSWKETGFDEPKATAMINQLREMNTEVEIISTVDLPSSL